MKLTEFGNEDLVGLGDGCNTREDNENGQGGSDTTCQLGLGPVAETYEVAMSSCSISVDRTSDGDRERETYPDNNRKPDLSTDEEIGSMTEKGLDDGRVEGIEERTRGEFPTIVSLMSTRQLRSLLSTSERSILSKVLDEEETSEPLRSQLGRKGATAHLPRCNS